MLNPRLRPGGGMPPKVVPRRGTTGRLPAQPLRQVSHFITRYRTLPKISHINQFLPAALPGLEGKEAKSNARK